MLMFIPALLGLFSSTPPFSFAQRCQFLVTELANRNFLAHLPTNVYFLCPSKLALFSLFAIAELASQCSYSCRKCSKYRLAPAQWLGFPQLNIAHPSRSRLCSLSLRHFHALATCTGDSRELRG